MEFCETQLKDRRRKRLVNGSTLSPTKGSAIYWGEPRGKEENLGWFRIGRNKGIGVSYRFASYSSKLATGGQEAVRGFGSSTFVRWPQLIHRLTHKVIPVSRSTSRSGTSVPWHLSHTWSTWRLFMLIPSLSKPLERAAEK